MVRGCDNPTPFPLSRLRVRVYLPLKPIPCSKKTLLWSFWEISVLSVSVCWGAWVSRGRAGVVVSRKEAECDRCPSTSSDSRDRKRGGWAVSRPSPLPQERQGAEGGTV